MKCACGKTTNDPSGVCASCKVDASVSVASARVVDYEGKPVASAGKKKPCTHPGCNRVQFRQRLCYKHLRASGTDPRKSLGVGSGKGKRLKTLSASSTIKAATLPPVSALSRSSQPLSIAQHLSGLKFALEREIPLWLEHVRKGEVLRALSEIHLVMEGFQK